eukprot:5823125-Prorocentrum_lima.AAC.1
MGTSTMLKHILLDDRRHHQGPHAAGTGQNADKHPRPHAPGTSTSLGKGEWRHPSRHHPPGSHATPHG